MKQLIFLVTLLIFLVGCANICPKPEQTFLQKMDTQNRIYLKGKIEKNEKLNKRQKFLFSKFIDCFRDLIQNPHTVRSLMKWQTNALQTVTVTSCIKILQFKHGDIAKLLEALK